MSARFVAFYAAFAALAIASNILAQWVVMSVYSGPWPIPASMVVGTGLGLCVKYMLDKRYIFQFEARGRAHEAKTFALYGVMGLITTAIFWCVELAFYWVFQTDAMRYLGGAIGLMIGYWLKYTLDSKFVFVTLKDSG